VSAVATAAVPRLLLFGQSWALVPVLADAFLQNRKDLLEYRSIIAQIQTDFGEETYDLTCLVPELANPSLHVVKHLVLNCRAADCVVWMVERFEDLQIYFSKSAFVNNIDNNILRGR
jgi:hypothetical protein